MKKLPPAASPVPMSLSDWTTRNQAFNETCAQLAQIEREQAQRRSELEAELRRLDKARAPTAQRFETAREALHDASARLIGPWVINHERGWPSANIYVHGQEAAWYTNRGWLRVAQCCAKAWTWELRMHPLNKGEGNRDVLFEPPVPKPKTNIDVDCDVDFRRWLQRSTELLQQAGYIVVPEGWSKEAYTP